MIVRLGPRDAGEVLTLQRAAFVTEAQAHRDLELPPLLQTLDELRMELARDEVLALGERGDDGRLLGAVRARISGTAAEIARLAVVPDLQGRGLGSRLLAAVEERLPAAVTDLWLFTGEHSTGNLRLYARHGYVETHRTPIPAGYDLVHMSKRR